MNGLIPIFDHVFNVSVMGDACSSIIANIHGIDDSLIFLK